MSPIIQLWYLLCITSIHHHKQTTKHEVKTLLNKELKFSSKFGLLKWFLEDTSNRGKKWHILFTYMQAQDVAGEENASIMQRCTVHRKYNLTKTLKWEFPKIARTWGGWLSFHQMRTFQEILPVPVLPLSMDLSTYAVVTSTSIIFNRSYINLME